jgi:hypothetical protein
MQAAARDLLHRALWQDYKNRPKASDFILFLQCCRKPLMQYGRNVGK